MDFVADAQFDGRKLRHANGGRLLHTRVPGHRHRTKLNGEDVVATLTRICADRGLPATIKTDNGSEFISMAMDKWAYERGVELDFSRPGKPTDNARAESFTGRLRQAHRIKGSAGTLGLARSASQPTS
jgi:putative transposase